MARHSCPIPVGVAKLIEMRLPLDQPIAESKARYVCFAVSLVDPLLLVYFAYWKVVFGEGSCRLGTWSSILLDGVTLMRISDEIDSGWPLVNEMGLSPP
jgi:hypothetical protein